MNLLIKFKIIKIILLNKISKQTNKLNKIIMMN